MQSWCCRHYLYPYSPRRRDERLFKMGLPVALYHRIRNFADTRVCLVATIDLHANVRESTCPEPAARVVAVKLLQPRNELLARARLF